MTDKPLNPFQRIADRAADRSTGSPGIVVWIALGLAVVGGWLGALHLPLDADTNALIGRDRPFMQRYQAFLDEFGDLEDMIVVVDPLGDDDAAKGRARDAVLKLDAALRPLVDAGQLVHVHRGVSAAEQWRAAPHAMEERELLDLARAGPALAALVTGDGARALGDAERAVAEIVPDRAAVEQAIVTLDALAPGLDPATGGDHDEASRAAARSGTTPAAEDDRSLGAPLPERFLRSEHGRLWFLQVMPAKDFADFNAIAEPLAAVRRVINDVAARHAGVEIGLTGKPVLQEDELATSNADMGRSSLLSLGVITLLFIWLFRGMRRPLLAVAAFGIAVGITMGLAWLLVGRITLLSSVFLLVLVGAGLDYGVHIVSRFNEYLPGSSRAAAAARTVREAGPGTLSGAFATAAVFALAMVTDFGGLRELGALACIGLLTSALVMVTVLPALLVIMGGTATAPPRSTGLWISVPARTTTVIAALTILIAMLVAPANLRFDANLLSMQADGLSSVDWERRVLADDATQTWFAASTAAGPDEAWELRERLHALPEVVRVRSAFDIVRRPTPAGDAARAALAAAIPDLTRAKAVTRTATEGASGPDAVPTPSHTAPPSTVLTTERAARIRDGLARLAVLAAASTDERASPLVRTLERRWTAVAEALADPARAADMKDAIDARAVRTARALAELRAGCLATPRDALPAAVRAGSISPSGSWLLQSIPRGDAWDEPTLRAFVASLRSVDPAVTGVPVTQVESIGDMRRAFEAVSWMSLVAVLVLAWIDFGSFRTALLATATVVAGVVLMLGALGPLGLSLNLANFFAVPMLLGLGIDSAIHVLHRWKRDPDGLPATLTATAFTGLTTAIGFGALVLADHRGLASLGWAMLVGSLACVVVAVVALPALLRWRAS